MTFPMAVVVTVKGRVQRVGYRRYVLDLAQEEGISGEVRNQKDGTVLVFAQAEEKALASFLRRLRTPPPPASVKEAHERKARPKKTKGFRMVSQGLAEEMQEGFGAMQSEFSDYRREFSSYQNEFKNFAGQTGADFRELGVKLDGFANQTNSNFTAMNQKYGEISEKLSAIMAQLAEQLQSMRSEAKETAGTLNESLKLLREAVDKLQKPA